MADARLVADVKASEGCKLVAYKDKNGFWTIGYGHLLDQTINWTGHEITQATADAMLAADLDDHAFQAAKLPEWISLDTDCRRNALIECVFNLGIGHWESEFPLTRISLRVKSWSQAGANLLHSPEWIHDVGLKRVARLADYLQYGRYADGST